MTDRREDKKLSKSKGFDNVRHNSNKTASESVSSKIFQFFWKTLAIQKKICYNEPAFKRLSKSLHFQSTLYEIKLYPVKWIQAKG